MSLGLKGKEKLMERNLCKTDVNTEDNKASSWRNHQIEVNPWIQPCLKSLDFNYKNQLIPFLAQVQINL